MLSIRLQINKLYAIFDIYLFSNRYEILRSSLRRATVAIILFLKGIAAVITIAFIAVAVAGFSEWVQGQRVSILINIYRQ